MKLIILINLSVLILLSACKANQNSEAGKKEVEIQNITQAETDSFPKPIGYVNDFEHVFTTNQINTLQNKIYAFEKATTNQIAIVTIHNQYTKANFDAYALALSKNWGVGQKDKNNGITIVLEPNIHRVRISIGKGLESIYTDTICSEIIKKKMIPYFIKSAYYEGINVGLEALIQLQEANKK